jgi:methyl-accepting chemotaxis protein
MTPATINTILNTAPMIIQGAGKLLKLIREQEATPMADHLPATVEEMKQRIQQIETALQENNRSDEAQIRLIEQLARQNESLAETLKQTYRRITLLTRLTVVAIGFSVLAILLLAGR